jgi:hypothetical protein
MIAVHRFIILGLYSRSEPAALHVLHWLGNAATPGQVDTARLVLIAWLQQHKSMGSARGAIGGSRTRRPLRDDVSPRTKAPPARRAGPKAKPFQIKPFSITRLKPTNRRRYVRLIYSAHWSREAATRRQALFMLTFFVSVFELKGIA